MYNQKYGQIGKKIPQQQIYENQYEEQQSEPLIEEVDPDYEPTDRQVRQYAIETLGMSFPEDQKLLYLAREGLKAPLPPNWVPYQGRDGEVYYKHRITQEKTYDHPTDLEYLQKYQQQKEKMARTNLKSMNMNMKANAAAVLGNNASSMFGQKLSQSNVIGGSNFNFANQMVKQPEVLPPKIDPQLEEQLYQQILKLQSRLKKEQKQFEEEERQRHEARLKKYKQEYQNELSRIYKSGSTNEDINDRIKNQKQKIRQRLIDTYEEKLAQQLKQYQKQLEATNKQFKHVYEEDNSLKIDKYRHQKSIQFESKEEKIRLNVQKQEKMKAEKKRERQQILQKLAYQLQSSENQQIEEATATALNEEITNIRLSYEAKIKQKQRDLELQFTETKKILGHDMGSYLAEMATKKARLKSISLQKIESYKKKQLTALNQKQISDFDNELRLLKQALHKEMETKLQKERQNQQKRLSLQKDKMDKQFMLKIQNQTKNVYTEMKNKMKQYEIEMNKKLSNIHEKFINEIENKSKADNKDITQRLQIKEKQLSLENKQNIIKSLKRQLQLDKTTFSILRLQREISSLKDQHQIDNFLLKLSKQHGLEYRSQQFVKYENQYHKFVARYKKDKEILSSLMNTLQKNQARLGPSGGNVTILKQYNQDVRQMRENQQKIRKIESLLRRAEINDRTALEELQNQPQNFGYKQIELRKEMGGWKSFDSPGKLNQFYEQIQPAKHSTTTQSHFQNTLKEHSKFLVNIRSQLNRKLYQIRNNTHF